MGNFRNDDMMDRNTIKDTGILEQYLLGELSENQQAEVENILKEDQELREYFNTIEEDFERIALENAVVPPHTIKTELFHKIDKDNTKIIPLENKNKFPLSLAIAASMTLFFMISSGWLYNQWKTSENNLTTVENETRNLNERILVLEKNLQETDTWYNAINNPNTIKLILEGNQISPSSKAITYVNHTAQTVILNPAYLTSLPDNQTYQMWADVDGEMIDMGVIPSKKEMVAMKYINNAASINITIEPQGGSEHPTVERLIANVLL